MLSLFFFELGFEESIAMTHTLFLFFNHDLTEHQKQDAIASLGVKRIVELPPSLKALWRSIPPELEALSDYISPFKKWLEAEACKGDYVLIQGDFGACYLMVRYCFEKGFVPVYSTTKREVIEKLLPDGSIELHHVFRHRRFRRYGQ